MNTSAVGMTIKTADDQGVILDNRLHVCITSLDIGYPGRIMTQGTCRVMEGIDTGSLGPTIGKLRCIFDAANGVTGITGRPTGKISGPHQDGMGGIGVLGVPIKVGSMTGATFSASRFAGGATAQAAISCAVAGLTANWRMGLACSHKRRRGRVMATNTVGRNRRVCRVYLDQ